jgi:hypothetical protein
MPTIIDATVGGASANSYATLAEATAYFATRLYVDDWIDAASDTIREQALIMAAREIDRDDYIGYRVSDTQALKWPRSAAQKPDSFSYYDTDEIPQLIKTAQFEWALEFVGSNVTSQSDLANFKRIKVDDIELEINQPVQSGTIPAEVARMLKDLRVNVSGAQIVRG